MWLLLDSTKRTGRVRISRRGQKIMAGFAGQFGPAPVQDAMALSAHCSGLGDKRLPENSTCGLRVVTVRANQHPGGIHRGGLQPLGRCRPALRSRAERGRAAGGVGDVAEVHQD